MYATLKGIDAMFTREKKTEKTGFSSAVGAHGIPSQF